MTKRYQEYPEYKNSGVEWLGNIPKSWNSIKFGLTNASAILGGNYLAGEGEEGVPLIKMGNLGRGHVNLNKVEYLPVGESYDESFLLKDGDFLFNTRNSLNLVGKVSIWRNELPKALYNSNILKISFNKSFVDSSKYMNYLFNSSLGLSQLSLIAKGTTSVAAIYYKELKSLVFMLPPAKEQQKIANFLDHETAKIDTLIAKQEKLIALLKEKRQAVISHAVTRGLNPNAPMKNSGVEWLGKVPEHWVVTPIKHIVELTPKKSKIHDKKELKCSFVPMDKLKKDSLVLDESKLISEVYDGYTYFENEDVLIAKVTPCFENKNMVVARSLTNGIGFGSSEIYVLRTNESVINDFLYYRLQEDAFMDIATAAMTGAGGLKRVPADVITNFAMALPPEHEQMEIIGFLQKRLNQLDSLSDKAKSAIELIKERKIALISAAVTGKIDVRNWQEM